MLGAFPRSFGIAAIVAAHPGGQVVVKYSDETTNATGQKPAFGDLAANHPRTDAGLLGCGGDGPPMWELGD
jgi:hypothetical protein